MEEIIAPIDRDLIKAELTPERFLRHTRKGGNDIYIVNCFNAPHTMSSFWYGIRMLRKYWAVIGLYWEKMSVMMNPDIQ